jgi:PAS domain S-box-containing protein
MSNAAIHEQTMTATLMAQLFDVTSDAIIVINSDQIIVRFNEGAQWMFGYRRDEIIGKPLDVLIPDRSIQIHREFVKQYSKSNDVSRVMSARRDISGRRKDGSEFPASAGIAKLKHNDSALMAVVLRDISAQRQLEEQARSQSILIAVETERNRLARELHDAVTQSLFSVNVMAEVLPDLWEKDREKGKQQLKDIRKLTRSALAEMRTLLLELRPHALIESKLHEVIQQFAETINSRSGTTVTINADEKYRLPADVQIVFYRIAQEALHNVAKHSAAKTAEVQLSVMPNWGMLQISDDGKGFAFNGISGTHMGLRIMRERANEVGAVLEIESAPGCGTHISVNWKGK